jgi:hypothetical protein
MKFAMPRSTSVSLWAARTALLLGLLAPAGAPAIQRCVGNQGEPLFTEHCANPVVSTRTRPAPRATVAAPARAGDFCARTPESLARVVDAALRARNGVRFSGFALWRGMSARTARGEARDLLRLMKSTSISVALQQHSDVDADYVETSTPVIAMMRVTERAGFTESEQWMFRIVRDHGCYWLDPQPERRRDESPSITADAPAPAASLAMRPQ